MDIVLVNIQQIGGRHLADAISFFLRESTHTLPVLIIGSSPADFAAIEDGTFGAIPIDTLSTLPRYPDVEVITIGKDRALADRQFALATEGLSEKSLLLARLASQALRSWWATRQSLSDGTPYEASAFTALFGELTGRPSGSDELELLSQANNLIAVEAENSGLRSERRDAVIDAVLHKGGSGSLLVAVRSEIAVAELQCQFAKYLDVSTRDLVDLGITIQSIFAPWPKTQFDRCVCAGYFGTRSIDVVFASGASEALMILDPVEARVAVWDLEKKYLSLPNLPAEITAKLKLLTSRLEIHAAVHADALSVGGLFGESRNRPQIGSQSVEHMQSASHVIAFFTDGSHQQFTAKARMEVLSRKKLRLQTVAARDLQIGDQVVLLKEGEREAFSEALLDLLDETSLAEFSLKRRLWLQSVQALGLERPINPAEVRRGLSMLGHDIDLPTIRSWIPHRTIEDCGVPEREDTFLAFASALGILLPNEILVEWFTGIQDLRKKHRLVGRQLTAAIRGAYLGRLEPRTVARLEKDWGIETRALLEAARVAIVDNLIPLGIEEHD
ncbi:hypothetical protein [Edaphobacter bradus]|uniref:hypothetical protein n=1 Tax=Edaphobacter bradus TaxID=2259016 RepID=UPI0021E0FB6A|nr:hypothetical protein [Edaphobacter bradus]